MQMGAFKGFNLSDISPVIRKSIGHNPATQGVCFDTFQIPILNCGAATDSCLNYSNIHF